MNSVLASARDTVRTQLWPLPVAGVVIAVIAAVLLPRVDAHVDDGLPSWLSAVLFGGDSGAARTLLDAISSSLITVTSLTFSLTVVTLQLASSQFSPRLLRTFTSDGFVQATLAIFLTTFTYSLTLLRAVRSPDTGAPFVPRISVTVAFVLALVSVLGLVLFLAHLARQIRVETMLRDVHDDASATLLAATKPLAEARPQRELADPPPDALHVAAPSSGFLTRLDEARLLSAAIEADAYLLIDCYPGSSLVEGVPLGVAWSASASGFGAGEFDGLQGAVGGAIGIGYERTAAQDVGYGLRQLTDVTNKALSPGINDPTTAVHALGHISAILCQLASRDLRSVVLTDDTGEARVVLRRPDFADIVDTAITQPRRYGASDPQVMERLFRLLEELAWHAHDHAAIGDQLARMRNTVARSDFDDAELARLASAAERVERTLSRRRGTG